MQGYEHHAAGIMESRLPQLLFHDGTEGVPHLIFVRLRPSRAHSPTSIRVQLCTVMGGRAIASLPPSLQKPKSASLRNEITALTETGIAPYSLIPFSFSLSDRLICEALLVGSSDLA